MKFKIIISLLILFCANRLEVHAQAKETLNIFSMREGCVLVSSSSNDHSSMWSPLNAFDGDSERGYSTAKGQAFDQDIIIELRQKYKVHQIVLDNQNAQDQSFCAKNIEIWGSVFDQATGFKKIATVTAKALARTKIDLPNKPELRRIKFVIKDNWGSSNQTQIMEIEGYGEAVGNLETAANFINGTYSSYLGSIKLRQNGTQILGCIEKDSGSIYGALTGNIVRFEYFKDATNIGAPPQKGAGIMIFTSSGNEANATTFEHGNIESLWSTKKNNMIACYCKMPQDNSIEQRLNRSKRAILFGISFEGSTATIKAESEPALSELLNALKNSSHKIQIEAYTDSTLTNKSNILLSTNQAKAVYDWLKTRGVEPSRISFKGFGESLCIADNATPQGRFLNNRIEISIK